MAFFSLRPFVFVAAVGAATLGCGVASTDADTETGDGTSEADVRVADGVVVADPKATVAAEVSADRVKLPASAGERYRTMAAGTVFVGARGAADGKNPDGFLRRVKSVAVEGDSLVVETTPAALTDAIVAGTVKASSGGGSKLDDHLTSTTFQGIELDFADKPLFDDVDDVAVDGKQASFHERITLDRAVLRARPTVDVDLRIQDNRVTRFAAKVEGSLDSSIQATADVSSTGVVDEDVLAALKAKKHEVDRRLYQSKRIALPTFSAGRIPVSTSVQFTVALRCTLGFGGAIHAKGGVEARSSLRLGGTLEDGEWSAPIRSEFDIQPTFDVTRGAELDARCALVADAELFVYGEPGVTMSVAPYVDFDVALGAASIEQLGPRPFVYKASAGATGTMRGRAEVFGLPASTLDRELVDWKAKTPVEGSTR